MKTILSVLLCLMFLGTAAFAQSSLDTPFIKKYRPRYEANLKNIHLLPVMQFAFKECKTKCSMEDKRNIQKLAEQGDMFGLALYTDSLTEESKNTADMEKLWKATAEKGEIISIMIYTGMSKVLYSKNKEVNREKFNDIKKLLTIAVEQGSVSGYVFLSYLYAKVGDTNNFCSITAQGIKKFSIEVISGYFVHGGGPSNLFFDKCTKQKPADILLKYGDEGKLIEGYINYKKGNYKEAFEIFSKLYKQGDPSRISANAGYCLGKLYYHGRGVEKSKSKGKKLLDESYNNGVVYYKDDPKRTSLPAKLEIISYLGGSCN